MQTQFVFRHMESSDALRNYAEERLHKISRYFSDPMKVSCVFTVEKLHHVAQFDVTLRNGLQLHASESTENMYSSIDMALAKMERQVRRYKDRISSHQPQKGRMAKIRVATISGEPEETGAEPADAAAAVVPSPTSDLPAVIREREFRAERLDVHQAIMQMNLLHKQFLVFTNSRTGDINVVYRDEGTTFGLIETNGHVDDAD
jgi:putative sigma-54 modulation protein